MTKFLAHHQQVIRFYRLTTQPPLCGCHRDHLSIRPGGWLSSYSSRSIQPPPPRLDSDQDTQPIELAEALKNRYVAPFKLIWNRLAPKKDRHRLDPNDHVNRDLGGTQKEIQKRTLPPTISEAWKIGLKGAHPSQFSRLRVRAATPVVPLRSPAAVVDEPGSIESSSSHPSTQTPDGINHPQPQAPKKSLLQSYLDLDKRSQKIISISVFVWSLSGLIYFTWFSPFEPSIQATLPSSKNPRTSLHSPS